MIPILDCGYGKFKCLLKLIKREKTEDQLYKGNLKRKKKREEIYAKAKSRTSEEKERETEQERLRNSFIHPD